MSDNVRLLPLPAEGLAPLATLLRGAGGLVEVPEAVQTDGVPGRFALALLSRPPVAREGLALTWLERHRHSAQTFVPLKAKSWALILVPSDAEGRPDLSQAQGYLCGPEDAVTIAPDVWHAGMMVFDAPADFAMWMWKAKEGEDGEVFNLDVPISVLT